ncbi:hypothetical protein HYG86_09735 [Alkalicella caledoniensis]|uniref:MazG-like family protein n=1 Tax=Alkalicella caledoniensis TaxID=2731377 RepID=A0A7G9W8L6_ALKCA|nr:MazG-like family protein [Alkalicella caledoniensis]QNO15028.1 hypothetical protein HYG86_09735 [Alkalicella caledoniensis]
MVGKQEKVDIIKNISSIEALKIKILGGITNVFDSLYKGKEEQVLDYIAGIMVSLYCLSKRIGFSFRKLDQKFTEKVNTINTNQTEFEEDINELKQYLSVRGD